jgi:hypothetical protein
MFSFTISYIFSNKFLNKITFTFLFIYFFFYSDGTLDQTHLQFLAEISSRNQDIKINEPPVTEPSVNESPEPEPEPIVKRK